MIKLKVTSRLSTPERNEKLQKTLEEMHHILNSTYFRDQMMKMKPKFGERSKWRRKTNAEIYNHIMGGSEVLTPEADGVLTWELFDYYSFKRVIGYTYPSVKKIWVNTKYLDRMTSKQFGSNQIHELGHKLGFSHDFRSTKSRPSSICYQLNDVYEKCHDKFWPKAYDKVKVCYRPWWGLKLYKKCYWKTVQK